MSVLHSSEALCHLLEIFLVSDNQEREERLESTLLHFFLDSTIILGD